MNKVVWKFQFSALNAVSHGQHNFNIEMPKGADILEVQYQRDEACMWAAVDPEQDTEVREFYSVGTGWGTIVENSKHIATVQEDSFVWHIFEYERRDH